MEGTRTKDVEQLKQLLRKADLESFFEPLQHIGVMRIAHLQDMRPVDFNEVGMSHLEQTRLRRSMKEEKGWKWTRLSEMVLRKQSGERAGAKQQRTSSGATPATSSSSSASSSHSPRSRAMTDAGAALNAIAAWKPQKPSWSIASSSVFRERHRNGTKDEAGSVYEGLHRLTGGEETQVFLVQLEASRVEGRAFRKEIALLHGLAHPNIMKFHGVAFDQPPYLVIGMCHRGTLSEELVLRGTGFLLTDLFQLAVQVADGLNHLEAKGLVHGEVKASNILMVSAKQCQVANFSLAQPMASFYHGDYEDYLNPAASSFRWMAPEVIKSHQYTHEGDVWSYACLLWEMTSHGETPWSGYNAMQVVDETDFPCRRRLARPTHCPDDLYALMHKCWSHDPKDRPLFAAIDTLTKQCTPKQLIACETIEHCVDSQLPIEAGTLVTVVNNDPKDDVWFGQNCHGQYGEFLPSSVTYSDDMVNGQRNSYLAQEAGSKRSSKSSTGGDPNISQPYDVKKLPVESDVQKLIEELTGMKSSNQGATNSSSESRQQTGCGSPHRSLTSTVSTPTSQNISAMRHRVVSNRQPKPGAVSSRAFTPESQMPPRASSSASNYSQASQPSMYTHQLALAPRQDQVARLRALDSPAPSPTAAAAAAAAGALSQRTVLTRRITEPAMPSPSTASPVFRFPEVGTGGERYTPTSLHEEQPTVVEVTETGEAIYDTPKNGCRRSEADYEDVTVRSSFTASLQEECNNLMIDSDSGYSPSTVNSPLTEAARQKPTWLESAQVQSTTNLHNSPMQHNLLQLPPTSRDSEPHYRAPRSSPTNGQKRACSPSLQGSSPRESIQSDLHVSPAKSSTSIGSQEPPPQQRLSPSASLSSTDGSPSGYQQPSVGKRPPPVPIRDPDTALSKSEVARSNSGNTFVKPATPKECGSPVPTIHIHRPRMASLSSATSTSTAASGCEDLNGTSTFLQSPPAMERIQRGWQRICSRQKLMANKHNFRASERRHRPSAAAARLNAPPQESLFPLTRQKSNPMIAMVGPQSSFSPNYENNQPMMQGLYRAKSSPNLHDMSAE